jgi:glyoxylase-like metal-dependent hydrolase (beta-lactamase superfamily II)
MVMEEKGWKAEALLPGSWRSAASVLVSNGKRRFVIDTGMPHEEHMLLSALHQRGLVASDIHAVINTHFHIDHVLNNSLFSGSAIYGTQESHDWCCSLYSDLLDDQNWEALVLKYYPQTLEYDHAVEYLHQMRRFTLRWWDRKRLGCSSRHHWLESCSLPEGLEAIFTSGHVPGHISVIVPEKGHTTIVAGDACLSRREDVRILTMIPRDRDQARRDRDQVLASGDRIFPGHDVEFEKNGNKSSP